MRSMSERFLSGRCGWSEFALCSNGWCRSVQPEIVALPGPSDRDCPWLGQPIGGEIDGLAAVEAFGPGDIGHRWRRI